MQVAAAAGVAAGTGAAQLGLGYGLGVVVWPSAPGVDDSVWLGSLGWATWIAASSTVFGAVVAGRLPGARGGPWRYALALAAGLGALLTVALVALPARQTVRPQTPSPETVAAGYALVGVLIGVVIAYWAVFSRPVAANLMVTAGYLWALAATAIGVELATGRDSATYLTSWQFADVGAGTRYGAVHWPSSLLTLLAALLIGMVAAWPAVRRGHFGVGAATSGAVGPLLVAAAFLVLAPRLTGAPGQLGSAYLIAPYAVLAGLAGSAFVVALGQRAAERRKRSHHQAAPPAATGVATVPAGDDLDPASPDSGSLAARSAEATAPGTPTASDAPSLSDAPTAEQPQISTRSGGAAVDGPGTATDSRSSGAGAVRASAAARNQPVGGANRPASPVPTQVSGDVEWAAPQAGSIPDTKPAPKRRRPASGATAAKADAATGGKVGAASTRTDDARAGGDASVGAAGSRSTVAAPPASPPVARINPPRDNPSPATGDRHG